MLTQLINFLISEGISIITPVALAKEIQGLVKSVCHSLCPSNQGPMGTCHFIDARNQDINALGLDIGNTNIKLCTAMQ